MDTAPDPAQLPALLRLVDDPSPAVSGPVLDALAAFGEELGPALDALDDPPEAAAREALLAAVDRHREGDVPAADDDVGAPGALVNAADGAGERPPARYEVGQLVRHRRYGYRGVVVAADDRCLASETWYQGNRTRPDRDQPWYHVLVHGSDAVTYAAQTSLLPDESCDAIEHPFVQRFFLSFDDGRYQRNDRPWITGE